MIAKFNRADIKLLYSAYRKRYRSDAMWMDIPVGRMLDNHRRMLDDRNRDSAMKAAILPTTNLKRSDTQTPLGGIDFNEANLDLQIKRDGKGVPLPVSQQSLESIKINGLIPIIIDIKPMSESPLLSQMQVSGVQGQSNI